MTELGNNRVAVVTDSGACLRPEALRRPGLFVVPLGVTIDTVAYLESTTSAVLLADPATELPVIGAAEVSAALLRRARVTTSRPSVARFAQTYQAVADAGFNSAVSVHLSGKLSGTVEAARQAAAQAPIPVTVVDSNQAGMAVGIGAVVGCEAALAGAETAEVVAATRATTKSAISLFTVQKLEYLRRGGRVGAIGAAFGTALAVKPLLAVRDGQVQAIGKVRSSARAREALVEFALSAADRVSQVAVGHIGASAQAEQARARLARALGVPVEKTWCVELSAALGAHLGPGSLAICVLPSPQRT